MRNICANRRSISLKFLRVIRITAACASIASSRVGSLAAARARGKKGGRPTALSKDKRELAVRLYHENQMLIAKICAMLGISKPTRYTYVRADEAADKAA